MELSIQKLSKNAVLPRYATPGSAGLDLCACLDAPLRLEKVVTGSAQGSWNCAKVPTGLAMAIPEGYVGLLFARSGLATKHGLSPANCVGVIDSDYRGEIVVALVNLGPEDYVIQPGERIAQLVIVPCAQPVLMETDALPETQRGTGGFGSTGR